MILWIPETLRELELNMLDIQKLLTVMKEHDASDLYITVDSPPAYRVNGVVRPAGNKCLEPEDCDQLARSVMNDKQQREYEETNEMNLALYYPSLGRYRVNIFKQRGCNGLVIRQIKCNILTLDDLKLPPVLKDVAMAKRGLVLFVGATGSGKSTSLAAMIDYRNENQGGHIITIEDPVEYVHMHKKSIITQREVGVDTDSFGSALKNTLRQAPDVILIGEIRDLETMEAAITFAETGHLCYATLHSNNANQAMERIMNFFPHEKHKQMYLQLSLNLRGIVSQRLVRTIDNSRTAAVEILLGSPRVRDLIHRAEIADLKEAMERGSAVGMQTFDMHLYDLFKEGRITMDEALKNADSANNLRLKIKLDEQPEMEEQGKTAFQKKGAKGKSAKREDSEVSLSLDG